MEEEGGSKSPQRQGEEEGDRPCDIVVSPNVVSCPQEEECCFEGQASLPTACSQETGKSISYRA